RRPAGAAMALTTDSRAGRCRPPPAPPACPAAQQPPAPSGRGAITRTRRPVRRTHASRRARRGRRPRGHGGRGHRTTRRPGTRELADADEPSISLALIRCAHDGLLPDGHHAALVTYKDRKRGGYTAAYLPMVGGLIDLAGEHGWTIRANVVAANDEFVHEEGL